VRDGVVQINEVLRSLLCSQYSGGEQGPIEFAITKYVVLISTGVDRVRPEVAMLIARSWFRRVQDGHGSGGVWTARL